MPIDEYTFSFCFTPLGFDDMLVTIIRDPHYLSATDKLGVFYKFIPAYRRLICRYKVHCYTIEALRNALFV